MNQRLAAFCFVWLGPTHAVLGQIGHLQVKPCTEKLQYQKKKILVLQSLTKTGEELFYPYKPHP